MREADWTNGLAKSLLIFLNGNEIGGVDRLGNRVIDDHFYILFNAHHEAVRFQLPHDEARRDWSLVLDTNQPEVDRRSKAVSLHDEYVVADRSLVMMRHVNDKA